MTQPDGAIEHHATIRHRQQEQRLSFVISSTGPSHQSLTPQPEAFLIAMLIPAMEAGENIVCDEVIDEDLLYSLRTQLIPYLSSQHRQWRHIDISAPTRIHRAQCSSEQLSVLGMSGGLDALTALAELRGTSTPEHMRPQALLMNNVGAFGKGQEKFHHDREIVTRLAADVALPLFVVESNMAQFYQSKYEMSYNIRNVAAAWAMGDRCRRATFASGSEYKSMGHLASKEDIAYHDPIIFPMLSSRRLLTHVSGSQHNRSDKFQIFLDNPDLHPYINTCLRSTNRKNGFINCGTCKKCSEIIFRAQTLHAMEAIESTFDIAAFERARLFLEYKLVYNANKKHPSENSVDTLRLIRQQRGRLSPIARALGYCVGKLN